MKRSALAIFSILLLFVVPVQAAQKAFLFKEKNLKASLKKNKKLLLYSVSEGMPLSMKGLPLIKKVARQKGYHLVVVNDPVMPVRDEDGKVLYPLAEQSPYYIRQGIFHHFPSLSLYRNGKQCGDTVPGYKTKKTFALLVKRLEKECGKKNLRDVRFGEDTSAVLSATLVKETILPRSIAYYYRPINEEWITYHDGTTTALFSRKTLQEILFQGEFDSIPSPDGKYMTLAKALRFFSMERILDKPADARSLPALYTDYTMDDYYQSIGVLGNGFYRVLTAWTEGVVARDYQETENTLVPLSQKKVICKNLPFNTPILSKNGLYVGGYLGGNINSTQVYQIGPSANECTLALDLGERTGKIDFNMDNSAVAYIASDSDGSTLGAYVKEVKGNRTWELGDLQANDAASYPSFLPNGNVLVLRIRTTATGREYAVQEYALNSTKEKNKE